MSLLIQILVTVLVLSVLVFFHELGHYTAGRLLNFTITEFALGMGPKLIGFKRKDIEYNLRAFPIGGMCAFHGEDGEVKDPRCFNAHKPWKRAIVILSGPVMNFVLAFVLGIIMFMGWGVYDTDKTQVYTVNPDSAAAESGIQEGDIITAVDGVPVEGVDSFTSLVDSCHETASISILRGGEELILRVTPRYSSENDRRLIGVTVSNPRVKSGLFLAIKQSAEYGTEMAGVIFRSLGMLFTGEMGVRDMSGVVGVTRVVGEAMSYGVDMVMALALMISVNLGIVNLMPIPALDGGRLLFIVVEWIRGKPIPPEKEGVVHVIGFILLMVLMVFLVIKDVYQWVAGVGI